MVFVRRVKTASGATAVQIAERAGGRDRVIEHLGSAHTPAELAALLEPARGKVHPGQGELDIAAGQAETGQAVITSKSSAVLWQVLTGAYARVRRRRGRVVPAAGPGPGRGADQQSRLTACTGRSWYRACVATHDVP